MCVATFARASENVIPFGPAYGAYPPTTQPPVAFLSPGECIAIRIDAAAPDGMRIQMDGDRATNWAATLRVDGGTPNAVAMAAVSMEVVEGVVTLVNHPVYVTLTAWPVAEPGCTRTLSLKRFDDGSVVVTGYGGADCSGPRSLKKYKTAIHYLGDKEREALHHAALRLRPAEYRYLEDPQTTRRLGVMLDDAAEVGAPIANGDRVDLYAYTTVLLTALQQQQAEIEELRARLDKREQADHAAQKQRRE